MRREKIAVAKDSSLIPTLESDLAKISLSTDADTPLDLSALGFVPLILLVRANGNFHDGEDAPDQSNDLWRDSGQVWSIPVNGRTTWHFKRQSGASTVTLYIKVLGSN